MLDVNGDQKVTAAEIAGFAHRSFKRLDANGDGILTRTELSQVLILPSRAPQSRPSRPIREGVQRRRR